jgi:hypothetical protein
MGDRTTSLVTALVLLLLAAAVIVGVSWLWETVIWWLIEDRVFEAAQAACWGG